jgi:hypothetical protein
MKRADEKSEIRDVIAEQRNRGRMRPSDIRTSRERKRFRDDIAKLFEAGDERGFILALQCARISEPQFSNALRVWRDLQATHSQTGGKP